MANRNSNTTRLPYDATSESRRQHSPATATFSPTSAARASSSSISSRRPPSNVEPRIASAGLVSNSVPTTARITSTPQEAMSDAPGPVDEHGIPITYTPITHRISKAKKGKKVHVCEYGCGKVFTRAEHRKRHEANHRTEPLFKCHIEDCQKPFQRIDLLTRHLERQHGIIQEIPQDMRQRRRRSFTSSAGQSKAGSPGPSVGQPQIMEPSLIGVTPPSTGSMSVGSGIDTDMAQTYPSLSSWNGPYNFSGPPDYSFEAVSTAEPSPLYSSDGWHSPGSENQQFQFQKQPYGSTYNKPIVSYASDLQSQPTSAPMAAAGIWTNSEGYLYANEGLGIEFTGQGPSPVARQPPAILPSNVGSAYVGSVAPETSAATDVGAGPLVSLDSETLQHYDDCYWEHFDPLFPILHHPTFFPANNPSLLGAMVLAIGSQLSNKPQAKSHSKAWFGFASRQCAAIDLDSISSDTLLATLQGIFLFEYLALYRSRSVGVHKSPQFSTMLLNLYSTQTQNASDPTLYATSLPANPTFNALETMHQKWVEMESRNRLLLASLILDTQRKMLFDQEPVQAIDSAGSFLPTPCHAIAWATTDFDQWNSIVSSATDQSTSPTKFQLAIATVLNFADSPSPLYSSLASYPDPFLQLARYTPVSSLITTAASSWLFARKVTLESWTASKDYLRSWTSSSDAAIATWWAGKILRTYFAKQSAPPDTHSLPYGLEEDWVLYLSALVIWAYTHPSLSPISPSRAQSRSSATSSPMLGSGRSQTLPGSSAEPIQLPRPDSNTLQLPARSYSYGHHASSGRSSPSISTGPTSRSISPVHMAAVAPRRGSPFHIAASPAAAPYTAMQAFLSRLDTDSWQDVTNIRGAGGVEGVLVGVRGALAKGGGNVGDKGALLGEAGRVLERLVEGRGVGW